MAACTGFEPVISALRGRRPKPLDEQAIGVLAGLEGVEPSLTEPESAVLPLDDSPVRDASEYITGLFRSRQGAFAFFSHIACPQCMPGLPGCRRPPWPHR